MTANRNIWKILPKMAEVLSAFALIGGVHHVVTSDCLAPPQAFSKKKTDDRKEWLTNFMEDRRQRRMHGLPEVRKCFSQTVLSSHQVALMCSMSRWRVTPALFSSLKQYLYGSQTKHLSYNDFINKELILFSNSDNERSIPSLVDGSSSPPAFLLTWVTVQWALFGHLEASTATSSGDDVDCSVFHSPSSPELPVTCTPDAGCCSNSFFTGFYECGATWEQDHHLLFIVVNT